MSKLSLLILSVICILIFSSCSPLYYGYLPGTDYKIYKLNKSYDLKKAHYNLEVSDKRMNINQIECYNEQIDRNTELEGSLGLKLLQESLEQSIKNSNGEIDNKSEEKIEVKLQAISFELVGFGFLVVHGFVQFEVFHNGQSKIYCSDMTDQDDDSPLPWYSLVTRKTGSRLILSGSLKRATENLIKDLEAGNI